MRSGSGGICSEKIIRAAQLAQEIQLGQINPNQTAHRFIKNDTLSHIQYFACVHGCTPEEGIRSYHRWLGIELRTSGGAAMLLTPEP